ncbi:hypothetical protein [Antarcticimicrobium sediminis]|uniref:Uncharacterized protein n=1 Tax=Antarcticimicrobium sediminis TaxID=2546227 RepID=A0A4R5F1I5_9RHOB|nr:hypothetical protein [Antarcticimicrobium sediminis]TDE40987.1 hypothetical protein E1B25_01895 [Antarcticimicrobium sediminis]
MPRETHPSDWNVPLSTPLSALCCAERCAQIESCGEAACFLLDWLDDLYRSTSMRPDASMRTRPR